jgi:hypothetical protein
VNDYAKFNLRTVYKNRILKCEYYIRNDKQKYERLIIMGIRLYYAKERKVEWAGGWFNYGSVEFSDVLDEIEGIKTWRCKISDDDWGDLGSIAIKADEECLEGIRKYIEKLRKHPNKYHSCFVKSSHENISKTTNSEVAGALEDILKYADRSNGNIYLTWS